MLHTPHPYRGRRAVLTTMHGKLQALAPPFAQALGLDIVASTGINTDALGTFTGETPRPGTMLQTAVAKARLGIQATGLPLALASEGSFGPHPQIPFMPAGTELLVFVDAEQGRVVHEAMVVAHTNFAHLTLTPGAPLERFLRQAGFPAHGLIVRPHHGDAGAGLTKGVIDRASLDRAVARAAAASSDHQACIETDMRAHLNPTRMTTLSELATRLAKRLSARCPVCAAPGWGRTETTPGLPCEACGTATQMIEAEVFSCGACEHRESRPRSDGLTQAPAARCPCCNP